MTKPHPKKAFASRDADRLLAHVSAALSDHIVPELGATVRQLLDWTGEAPASVPGASEPTGSTPEFVEERGDDSDEARLTKLERDAVRPDGYRLALAEVSNRLACLVSACRQAMVELCPDVPPPVPPQSGWRSSAVAYAVWAVARVESSGARSVRVELLQDMATNADRLVQLCTSYRPPPAKVRPSDVCHAHDAAGAEAFIDRRRYGRWHLCRWCGDFRTLYGVNPPPKAVRMHEKGQKVTPAILRNMGVHVKARRRGA